MLAPVWILGYGSVRKSLREKQAGLTRPAAGAESAHSCAHSGTHTFEIENDGAIISRPRSTMHPEPHPEWGDTTLSTTRADTPGGKVFATCDVTGKDLTLGDWYHKRGEDFDICGEEFGRRPAWEQRFYVAVTTLEALGDERSEYESDAEDSDKPKKTPLSVALETGNAAIIELLKSKGANA